MTDDPIPRNVALTLRLFRESTAHSLRSIAEELNKTPGRKIRGKGRGEKPAKFDHDLIEAIEAQKRLKIWHLGRYANWWGMPVGAILLFSQLASHLRDGKEDDVVLAKSVAEAVKGVCDYVIANADALASDPNNGGTDQTRDKRLEALVRKCAYKKATPEQKSRDARLVAVIHRMLNQYPVEAKAFYRDHVNKTITQGSGGS
jgi:hypothetical protein